MIFEFSKTCQFSQLCCTVAKVVVRMGTVKATTSHIDFVQVVAACGCSHSQTCAAVAFLTVNVSQATFFWLLIAEDREPE